MHTHTHLTGQTLGKQTGKQTNKQTDKHSAFLRYDSKKEDEKSRLISEKKRQQQSEKHLDGVCPASSSFSACVRAWRQQAWLAGCLPVWLLFSLCLFYLSGVHHLGSAFCSALLLQTCCCKVEARVWFEDEPRTHRKHQHHQQQQYKQQHSKKQKERITRCKQANKQRKVMVVCVCVCVDDTKQTEERDEMPNEKKLGRKKQSVLCRFLSGVVCTWAAHFALVC